MRNGTQNNGTVPHTDTDRPAPGGAGPDLSWDALPPVISRALAQPLAPHLVSQRSGRGGRSFHYLEGHTAIDQANQVFGYGGWGYELVGDVALHQIESTDHRSGEIRRSLAYSATVRVSVPGALPRTDVGFQPVTDESADGHETAYKGAVTDALKRALRSFGDRFGNGLYGDPPTTRRSTTRTERPSVTPPSAAPRSSADEHRPRTQTQRPNAESAETSAEPSQDRDARNLRAQLIDLCGQQGFSEEQVRAAVRKRTGRELAALGPAELNPLIASAAEKLQRVQDVQTG